MPEVTGLYALATGWVWGNQLVGYLMFAMICDLISGVMAAAKSRNVNSSIATDGWIRKSAILLAVCFAWVMEPLIVEKVGAFPIGEVVTLGFISSETISIIENLGRAGVVMPDWFKGVFGKLSGAADRRDA